LILRKVVNGDELLDHHAVLIERLVERGHLIDVFFETLRLNLALVLHLAEEVLLVGATDHARRGGHRSNDERKEDDRENDRDSDRATIEEEISDLPANIARMQLNLDHWLTR
jgi:hypothetical protein